MRPRPGWMRPWRRLKPTSLSAGAAQTPPNLRACASLARCAGLSCYLGFLAKPARSDALGTSIFLLVLVVLLWGILGADPWETRPGWNQVILAGIARGSRGAGARSREPGAGLGTRVGARARAGGGDLLDLPGPPRSWYQEGPEFDTAVPFKKPRGPPRIHADTGRKLPATMDSVRT